ncbi:hypothetical protein CGGC5_v017040 [Colletotrichum fructicola Nara gc5]|uniref:Uncharacterized protein n=1 Tax=Colletotrichum fructicola (strain Nara gc5) TaxID=1213859 RepID=A0A7J6IFN1_COLFN|nr:hypothetical protein CGGC5_v017040 [Colletotrichum fructicola Nara gc5]
MGNDVRCCEHAVAERLERCCHCSLLNVTTANLVKNVSDAFDVFDKDQSQRRLTIPDDISDPFKSIATKAGAHVATVVASADKAISTGAVGLMDGLNGWRDAVPVYVCLQTRGVWQLGYPNDTTKLVPYGELNMSQTFHIKALENLWQAARLVVPGLPEIEALDMDSADLGALSGLGIAPYWLLSFVLVGTCTAIVLSIFLPQGLLLLCIPRIVTVALLFVVLCVALACMAICVSLPLLAGRVLSVLGANVTTQPGIAQWLSVGAVVWTCMWALLQCVCV